MELKLHRSTQDILELISKKTKKPFEFIKKPDLRSAASIKIARKNMPSHLLFYREDKGNILDHLIAHECGHIYRMWDVPPEDRKIPATNDENRRLALTQIEGDIAKLTKVFPVEQLNQLASMWFNGIIQQITNIPEDIRIEKWIFDNYPDLRRSQVVSIDRQMKESVQVLSKRIEGISPKKIYDASNHINCSFAISMESLIGKKYTAPYRNTSYLELGRKLADLVIRSDDKGYKQGIEIIDQWTELLGLKGWFYWIDFEDVPLDYLLSH